MCHCMHQHPHTFKIPTLAAILLCGHTKILHAIVEMSSVATPLPHPVKDLDPDFLKELMQTEKVSLKSCSEWPIMYAHSVVYPSTKGVSILLGRKRRWRWHKLPCIFTHQVHTPSAIRKWTPGVSLCKNCSKWSIMYAHTVVYPSTKGVSIILGRKRRWRWHKLPCFFTHQLHTPSAIQKWTPFPSVQSRTNLAKASWLSSLNMSPSPCTPPTPSNKSNIQNSNQARMMSCCCSLASPSPFLFIPFQE